MHQKMEDGRLLSICFVCLGNICRSPTAEAVFRRCLEQADLAEHFHVESAGTGDWHLGCAADRRSQATAAAHGLQLPGKAQLFAAKDFCRFDYVVALDEKNQQRLRELAPDAASRRKILLLRRFDSLAAEHQNDVPDPYYGGPDGFEEVFAICERACQNLLQKLQAEGTKSASLTSDADA